MTSRSYFGKMNSTLGSVVPLAMFYFSWRVTDWRLEGQSCLNDNDCDWLRTDLEVIFLSNILNRNQTEPDPGGIGIEPPHDTTQFIRGISLCEDFHAYG